MWKMLGNITEIFIYSAVYIIIVLVSLKVVGATFTPDFEKRISEEGNIGLSIVCACVILGIALLCSAIIR